MPTLEHTDEMAFLLICVTSLIKILTDLILSFIATKARLSCDLNSFLSDLLQWAMSLQLSGSSDKVTLCVFQRARQLSSSWCPCSDKPRDMGFCGMEYVSHIIDPTL